MSKRKNSIYFANMMIKCRSDYFRKRCNFGWIIKTCVWFEIVLYVHQDNMWENNVLIIEWEIAKHVQRVVIIQKIIFQQLQNLPLVPDVLLKYVELIKNWLNPVINLNFNYSCFFFWKFEFDFFKSHLWF